MYNLIGSCILKRIEGAISDIITPKNVFFSYAAGWWIEHAQVKNIHNNQCIVFDFQWKLCVLVLFGDCRRCHCNRCYYTCSIAYTSGNVFELIFPNQWNYFCSFLYSANQTQMKTLMQQFKSSVRFLFSNNHIDKCCNANCFHFCLFSLAFFFSLKNQQKCFVYCMHLFCLWLCIKWSNDTNQSRKKQLHLLLIIHTTKNLYGKSNNNCSLYYKVMVDWVKA